MSHYTGSLQSLRRPELLELVKDLGVAPKHNGYLSKYELTELVRATLKQNSQQRQDPRFEGIWQHMPESEYPREEFDQLVKENGAVEDPLIRAGRQPEFGDQDQHSTLAQLYSHPHDDTEQSTRDTSPSQSSPLPSMREAMLHPHIFETLRQASPRKLVNSALSHASNAIDQLQDHADTGEEAEVGPLALVPASRSLRRKASRSLSLVTKQSSHNLRVVARGSVAAVAEAQYRLSSSWVLILAILFAEYSWIAYEALPWIEYSFGPCPSLVLPDLPATSFHFPAFHLLLHPFFTFALIRYSFQTLLLPLLVSLIFAFPQPYLEEEAEAEAEGIHSRRRHRQRRKLCSPSPLLFSLTRLSIALWRGYIFPSPSDTLPGGGGGGLALHEIASHSRLRLSQTLRTLLQEAATAASAAQSSESSLGKLWLSSWKDQRVGWKEMVGGIAGNGNGERRWKVEEIVEGGKVWGVGALGMGFASVVSAVMQQH